MAEEVVVTFTARLAGVDRRAACDWATDLADQLSEAGAPVLSMEVTDLVECA